MPKKVASATSRSNRQSSSGRAKSEPRKRKTGAASRSSRAAAAPGTGVQRINKILASAGLGSRREVEELILQGRVEIDHEVVTDLASKADPSKAAIKVDGQTLKRFRPVYFVVNKPKGVLSTNKDPSGRMRVVDLIPGNDRVFCVGRLDKSSEGLMLVTNDGELAQRLAHPRFRVTKTYFVVVAGQMTREELAKLHKGVYLAEGFAKIDGARIRKQRKHSTEIEIQLSEGKNREIRRILARAGHKVVILRRVAIGPLKLATLPVGASRQLTAAEIRALYDDTSPSRGKKRKTAKAKRAKSDTADSTEESHSPVTAYSSDMDDDFISGDFSADTSNDGFVFEVNSGSQGAVLDYEDTSEGSNASTRRSPPRKGRKKVAARSPQRTQRTSAAAKPTAKKRPSTKGKPRAPGKPGVKAKTGAKTGARAGVKGRTGGNRTSGTQSRSGVKKK